jgi:hypothetical protein
MSLYFSLFFNTVILINYQIYSVIPVDMGDASEYDYNCGKTHRGISGEK